ncbi:MAG: YidB family protein [Polaromonas sp.]|nr:YidB family protein [Polaromonas sp.]
MGLLDSVLGSVMNGQTPGGAAPNPGAAGGLGGLMGMLANNPQLIQIVLEMLSNNSAQGGLGGLVAKFQQAGLGDAIASWIGGGPNLPVSGAQVTDALGSGTVSGIAAQLGIDPAAAASQLSQILPGLVNQLTPDGEAPAGGLGNSGDLMGMLGGLLQRR